MAEFLLVLFSIFLILSIFRRQILRWVFGLIGRKLQKQFQKAAEQQAEQEGFYQGAAQEEPGAQRHTGEIRVHIPPKAPKKRGTFKGGEYVDFEEVKEEERNN